ncbi:BTAD domain-containing putative transcriptional regulator [Deinococcus yavapaiensis]|uniref:DNA-binding SARP family transcriptional activator n=1 Tax=Deinococcus yavapaiensis KR-236 TaxID=694435 RepID=A0A318S5R0_9DEIO|nr:BTAD domain-containing putative transcriptional regulator [Deinococcus yavapaiensis]PYE54122.1 DNA-binding SARP family transcriptional activator [Deinococcus yavapaiensis KR-236]
MDLAAHLVLLGSPALLLDGRPASPITRKSLSILALLHEEGTLTRPSVASMLWGNRGDDAALHNLRQELYRLSKLAPGLVVSDGKTLSLASFVTSDVRAVREANERHGEAVPLGSFLEGVDADDEAFGEWLGARRADADRIRVELLRRVARRASDLETFEEARRALEAALTLDPLREDVWRDFMTVLAREGRHDELTGAYERLRAELEAQVGGEPLAETREVFERLRSQSAASPLELAKTALHEAREASRLHRHEDVRGSMRALLKRLHDEAKLERPFIARACELLFSSAYALGDVPAMEEAVERLRGLARLDLTFETLCVAKTAALWTRQGRLAEVRDLTREAWEEREHRDDQAEVLLWRGVALLRLGDLPNARDTLSLVTDARLPAALAAEASLGLGAAALNLGRLDEAGEHLRAALRAARRAGEVALTVRARANLGVWHLLSGEQDLAARTLTRAAEDARALSQPAMTRMLLVNLFKALYELGRLDEAGAALDEAFSLLRDAPDPHVEGALLNNLGALARARGDYGATLDALARALDNARATGNKMQEVRRLLARADVLTELGATTEAHEDVCLALDLVRRHGLREVEPWANLLLAEAALQLGNVATCAARLEDVALVKESLSSDDATRWRCDTAALALARSDADAALAALADPPDPSCRALHLSLRARAKRASNLDVSQEREEALSWLRGRHLVALDEVRVRRALGLDLVRADALLKEVRASLQSEPSVLAAFDKRWASSNAMFAELSWW